MTTAPRAGRPAAAGLVALQRFAVLMDEQFAIPSSAPRIGLDALLAWCPG